MSFIGKFYADGGSDIPFSLWLSELADKFPKEKIDQLKFLIECKFFRFFFCLRFKKTMAGKIL